MNLPSFQNKTAIMNIPTVPMNSSKNTIGSISLWTLTGMFGGRAGRRGIPGTKEWLCRVTSGAIGWKPGYTFPGISKDIEHKMSSRLSSRNGQMGEVEEMRK